ncbi:MAG: zinc ABC transporter substrate-binding protein [Candidatus Latescibacteria bacterium]|nr:zinc ABC transporter substrate-binding protein [Candidatus Latescibacterota bacterium]
MHRAILALALIGLIPAPAPAEDPFKAVCTVGMITDVVTEIAGDRAEVTGLMGPGVDPHLYKPTRSDIATLMRADVVFYNGLLLEGKMTDSLIRAATSGKKVWAVTELLDEQYLLEPEEFKGLFDPHVWMDPASWRRAAIVIRDKLAEFDPEGRDAYAANAERYLAELDRLDAYARDVLATVPESQRVLVTAHDAFNYFGRRFGYEVVGIQGISTESEAGVKDIERIVSLIVERDVRAVFVESTVSERNIRALIDGARAQGHEVAIGGRLFSDAMGPPGAYEGTYIGMIDHNVTTIARALGGTAPERGMQGRLSP